MKWVGGRGRERAKEVGERERRGCGRGDVDERLVAESEHMRAGNIPTIIGSGAHTTKVRAKR